MANSKRREWVLETTWEGVEKLMADTAHKFIRKYGSPSFEDALGIGHVVFMRVMNHDDPVHYRRGKGSFSGWLRFKFWHALLEDKEKEARRHAICPRDWSVDISRYEVAEAPGPGGLTALLDDLPADARVVAKLVLNPPLDLRFELVGRPNQSVKQVLMCYLVESGWSRSRVVDCFERIADALAGKPPRIQLQSH